MNIKTKKFWVMVGLELVTLYGMVSYQIPYMSGLEYMVYIAVGWGGLDTAVKFTKK